MAYRPVFLDANLLSIFTEIGRVDLLMRLLNAHELYVSPAILNELSTAVRHGHTHVQAALDLIGTRKSIQVTAPSADELSDLRNLPTWMAAGEAECIVVCQTRGWVFSSFDRKAINYCVREKILYLTLPAILAALWKNGLIPQQEVQQIIQELEQGGRQIRDKAEIFKEG